MNDPEPPPTHTAPPRVEVIGIAGVPEVRAGDDLASLLLQAAEAQGAPLLDGDVLVVSQRVVSKAEGRVLPLDRFAPPSDFARRWGERWERDPRLIEAILQESTRIVRQVNGVLITEHRLGFVCANAGVDASNVGGPGLVSLLPLDPDASARTLRDIVRAERGIEVAVVVSDTFGRAWREGQVNVAIGVAGLRPVHDLAGTVDRDGVVLRVTAPCVADELAAAGGLVMAKAAGIPAAIVRGISYEPGEGSAREIVRARQLDLFL